jgi:acyl-CoA thioesterase-2
MKQLAELQQQFELERLEVNLFRGASRDIGSPQVFGGQVLGQALMAAYATVEGRVVHSLHAYFLRRGDFNLPIVYQVDRSRDGSSFSSRRVIAIQNGAPIFTFSSSFQPEKMRRFLEIARPFELRPVQKVDYLNPAAQPPVQQMWFKTIGRLPDDDVLHRCLLAYVSDYNLLNTAVLPHKTSWVSGNLMMASIDHAMWFHRSFRVDDWLLYSMDSPSASGARGFARGSIFTRDGKLVASTAQEGVIRVMEARPE